MSPSNLLRLEGLAALIGGALVAVLKLVDVVSLFFLDPFESNELGLTILYLLDPLSVFAQVLITLGLIGLYIHQSRVAGTAGLIAFVLTFSGMVLIRALDWAASLTYLGWALFGASNLEARVYPGIASVLLILSALATGLARPTASPLPIGPDDVAGVIGTVAFIILNAVVAWLGFILFSRRLEEAQGIGEVR
jgi:membrane-bound ClpP family serine protease